MLKVHMCIRICNEICKRKVEKNLSIDCFNTLSNYQLLDSVMRSLNYCLQIEVTHNFSVTNWLGRFSTFTGLLLKLGK